MRQGQVVRCVTLHTTCQRTDGSTGFCGILSITLCNNIIHETVDNRPAAHADQTQAVIPKWIATNAGFTFEASKRFTNHAPAGFDGTMLVENRCRPTRSRRREGHLTRETKVAQGDLRYPPSRFGAIRGGQHYVADRQPNQGVDTIDDVFAIELGEVLSDPTH